MLSPVEINDNGQAVYTESQIDYITAVRKVRPARGAFGDWGSYDENGNPTLIISGSTEIVSEQDDLANDWGYGTQAEQRRYERGDEVEYDPTSYAWFARKGDRVELRTERTAYNTEKVFGNLPGYHHISEGTIQCWYCATTFNAKWFAKQDREVSRNLMEHFAVQAIVHSLECKDEHNGLPLLRMVGYDGKPRHQRASLSWGKPAKIW